MSEQHFSFHTNGMVFDIVLSHFSPHTGTCRLSSPSLFVTHLFRRWYIFFTLATYASSCHPHSFLPEFWKQAPVSSITPPPRGPEGRVPPPNRPRIEPWVVPLRCPPAISQGCLTDGPRGGCGLAAAGVPAARLLHGAAARAGDPPHPAPDQHPPQCVPAGGAGGGAPGLGRVGARNRHRACPKSACVYG